ncbi:hypothetical protein GDO78_023055 [Eleutherodactylus coqui]|uniref:Uncharacterized protein n=1 Tax=Eleutherodactylus coqui TaxID=57060 RepID=A0A8J6BFW8_ELECQ|nr:hypothetical protein GDO78_023055 [Eleutherodactylus coqui]
MYHCLLWRIIGDVNKLVTSLCHRSHIQTGAVHCVSAGFTGISHGLFTCNFSFEVFMTITPIYKTWRRSDSQAPVGESTMKNGGSILL